MNNGPSDNNTLRPEIEPPPRAWATYLPWLPVLLFSVAIVVVHVLQPEFRHESQAVVSMLYTLFCAAPAVVIVFLAGRTFLGNGSLRMLLLGMGAVFFATIYLLAALLLPDYNAGVTVHNVGFLASGIWLSAERAGWGPRAARPRA